MHWEISWTYLLISYLVSLLFFVNGFSCSYLVVALFSLLLAFFFFLGVIGFRYWCLLFVLIFYHVCLIWFQTNFRYEKNNNNTPTWAFFCMSFTFSSHLYLNFSFYICSNYDNGHSILYLDHLYFPILQNLWSFLLLLDVWHHLKFWVYTYLQGGIVYFNKVVIVSSMNSKGRIIGSFNHELKTTLSTH